MLEEPPRVREPFLQDVVVREPEAAGEKRALTRRQSVLRLGAVVAEHEAIDEQALLDRRDGALHARIVRGKESDDRDHEHARVELPGAIRLHEGVQPGVEALLADLVVYLLAQRAPTVNGVV